MRKLLTITFSLFLLASCVNEESPVPVAALVYQSPEGFPPMPIPADNYPTAAGIELGRMLFYDPILSGDSSQSCGSCHGQAFGFTDDGKQFSTGIDGLEGNMNSMQIINIAWGTYFFWDGRAEGMEDQALGPVENPIEMHDDWGNVEMKLRRHPDYPNRFKKAFGTQFISRELAVKAIAQFERSLIAGDSKYHKVEREAPNVQFTEQEQMGFELFFSEKADCFHCHVQNLLTDFDFHNNGLDSLLNEDNLGRFDVTGNPQDHGKFKTGSLVNIAETAPYMHDGRFLSLEEVIEHYNSGIQNTRTLDPLLKRPAGLELSEVEKAALVAFLETMSDQEFLTNPDFMNPFD